jgi:hypothetical protein
MTPNRNYFGTGGMRYKEKQLYKKFRKLVRILPRGWLDKS